MDLLHVVALCCCLYASMDAAHGATTPPVVILFPPTPGMPPWMLVAIIVPSVVGGLTLLSCCVYCMCCKGRCCMGGMQAPTTTAAPAVGLASGYTGGAAGWGSSTNYISTQPAITDTTYVSSLPVNGAGVYGSGGAGNFVSNGGNFVTGGNIGAGMYSGGNLGGKCSRCQGNQPRYGSGAYGTSLPVSGGCGCNRF